MDRIEPITLYRAINPRELGSILELNALASSAELEVGKTYQMQFQIDGRWESKQGRFSDSFNHLLGYVLVSHHTQYTTDIEPNPGWFQVMKNITGEVSILDVPRWNIYYR